MLGKLKGLIKNSTAYALGFSEGQLDKMSRDLLKDPANHILHGFFEPIFTRHAELLIRSNKQSHLTGPIDDLIKKAGSPLPDAYRSACFNITVDSICLYHHSMHKSGYFLKSPLFEYIQREWLFFDEKIGLGAHKSKAESLLKIEREKKAYADRVGVDHSEFSELYAITGKIGAFAVDIRKPFYAFGGKANMPELIQVWRWVFGSNKDSQYESHSLEFEKIYRDFHANTLRIMGEGKENKKHEQGGRREDSHKGRNESSIVLPCPECGVRMRLSSFNDGSVGRCGKCKAPFLVKSDGDGKFWLEAASEQDQFSSEDSSSGLSEIADALFLLGLEVGATSKEIKNAYRIRMSQYHPDKVQGLGDKIKKIALEETQSLNSAIETLKRNGLL